MFENKAVIWSWSSIDPINVLFIYRSSGREVKIDIREYVSQSGRYHLSWLSLKEKEVLNQLKQEHG